MHTLERRVENLGRIVNVYARNPGLCAEQPVELWEKLADRLKKISEALYAFADRPNIDRRVEATFSTQAPYDQDAEQ